MNILVFLFAVFELTISFSDLPRFPSSFIWGTATASYQVEGAYNQGGRSPSIWDVFCEDPKHCSGQNGSVADDHYHRVMNDTELMHNLGVNHYRMSLSWSRLLPDGVGKVNQLAVDHYNKEIDFVISKGIKPLVTLYHWDLPQVLEENGGWRNKTIVDSFEYYAKVAFDLFGDRVPFWATINEPMTVTILGFLRGTHAPGRCSDRTICPSGDSETEPYMVTHHLLLAHGRASALYRNKYQEKHDGSIGIVLNCDFSVPLNVTSKVDQEAAQRYLEFQLGWFADPIYFGDYPAVMRERVGDRLPKFTQEEKEMMKGSNDMFFLNHYTSSYASVPTNFNDTVGWFKDMNVNITRDRDGVPMGPRADSEWLYVYPQGIRDMVNWVSKRFNDTRIVVTENGCDVPHENKMTLAEALNDTFRVDYYSQYLSNLSAAIFEDHIDVHGYFAWSLMDNFEWNDGYSKRFGIHYVNYTTQHRYPKRSAHYFKELIKSNTFQNNYPLLFALLGVSAFLAICLLALVLKRNYCSGDRHVEYHVINQDEQ
jgi:beta-glucosidase